MQKAPALCRVKTTHGGGFVSKLLKWNIVYDIIRARKDVTRIPKIELYATEDGREVVADFQAYKNKTLAENAEVREEYERLGPQYEAICAAIESRKEAGLTQKELAERMGTAQANISRFENGNANPSLEFLQKMASCMGKRLRVSFE